MVAWRRASSNRRPERSDGRRGCGVIDISEGFRGPQRSEDHSNSEQISVARLTPSATDRLRQRLSDPSHACRSTSPADPPRLPHPLSHLPTSPLPSTTCDLVHIPSHLPPPPPYLPLPPTSPSHLPPTYLPPTSQSPLPPHIPPRMAPYTLPIPSLPSLPPSNPLPFPLPLPSHPLSLPRPFPVGPSQYPPSTFPVRPACTDPTSPPPHLPVPTGCLFPSLPEFSQVSQPSLRM